MSVTRAIPGASAALLTASLALLAWAAPAAALDPGLDPGAGLAAPAPSSSRFT